MSVHSKALILFGMKSNFIPLHYVYILIQSIQYSGMRFHSSFQIGTDV